MGSGSETDLGYSEAFFGNHCRNARVSLTTIEEPLPPFVEMLLGEGGKEEPCL